MPRRKVNDLKPLCPVRILSPACLVASSLSLFAADKITYDDHVFPIFEQSCLNCHNPDKTKGGLDLSSYTNTLKGGSGGKVAEPGDTASPLLTSVMRSGELKMPPEGDAISPAQVATIKAWIEGGLLENKNSSARAAKKPAFQANLSAAAGKKPEGPPPLPQHVLLEPAVTAARGAAVQAIAASPWAPLIAISSLRQVMLVNTDSLELVGILPFPEGEPVSLTFTPDARYLVVGGGIAGKSGLTVTFDVTTGQRVLTAAKEFDSILCADIRPGFDIVATGSPSRLVKLWNTQTNEQQKSMKKHTDWLTALDISPDGILLATGDRNGGVLVWEADSGGDFHTLRAHQAAITHAAFRADSNLLGTSSEDGTIRMWEMNGGTEVKKIDAHPGGVAGFDWARDGSFASTGRDQKVRLWKTDFNVLRELGKVPALPTAIAIEAEGKRVFVGDINGQIHVIDSSNAQVITVLNNHPPTLAERIRYIDERLASLPNEQTQVQQEITTAQTKHEQHQQSIKTAEAALQQNRQVVAQAQQKLNGIKGKLDATRKTLAAKKAELDAQRAQLTAAQSTLDQSRQQLATTQAAGVGPAIEQAQTATREAEARFHQINATIPPLETAITPLQQEEQTLHASLAPAEKEFAAAQEKVAPAEAALKALRDATPAIEQALAAAKKKQQDSQDEPLRLRKSRHHWIAAQTNARALSAKKEALTQQNAFEDQASAYAEAAKAIETLAAARLKEEQAFSTLMQETPPTEEKAHAAWQQRVNDQKTKTTQALEAMKKAEAELVNLRMQIEAQSPARVLSLTTSQQLHEEYLRQLAEKIE